MRKRTVKYLGTALIAAALAAAGMMRTGAQVKAAVPDHSSVAPVLSFTMPSLAGRKVPLARYQGKVILMVNTASKCGFTPQYAGLEALYKRFKSKGFVILGFPSNDFGHQEPGTNKQISIFCTSHYGVTFPMFSKVDVKGPHQCSLYRYLTGHRTDPRFAGVVKWNFEKFLISRRGKIVARFRSAIKPQSAILVHAVERQLAR
ncbi:MAG: glutathione peroxidase [Planctomycetia bacterium]|nr:glutathione peroxidase [Planctomycetia bacterium]